MQLNPNRNRHVLLSNGTWDHTTGATDEGTEEMVPENTVQGCRQHHTREEICFGVTP